VQRRVDLLVCPVLRLRQHLGVHAEEDSYGVPCPACALDRLDSRAEPEGDPIARHVEPASNICRASISDARHLDAEDNSYDVVLLLGPLYHLPDLADRRQALAEAHRVVRPAGLVAAAAINRYASLFEHAPLAHLYTERMQASISEILRTATYDGNRGFTLAYFHRADSLADELHESGLTGVTVFGVEGTVWLMLKAVEQCGASPLSDALFDSALTAARLAEPYPELLASSSHLLAIGEAVG
jgi:SAM-dependent methyltransferase